MRDESKAVHEAKAAAWGAALDISGRERLIAAGVMRTAEFAVMRRLLAATLSNGEAGFWQLVEAELRS